MGAIERLLSGTESRAATAQFRANQWRISGGSDELGDLSAYPGFEESTDLLVRYARQLGASNGPSVAKRPPVRDPEALERLRRTLDEPDPQKILSAILALDPAVPITKSDSETIRTTVSSLAWLSVLSTDKLELSDALLAQAWAWLALEKALEIRGNEGSEALLTWALGYEAAAARASATLPEDEPIRLFVAGQEKRLDTLCARNPTESSAHLLRLALLAERGDIKRFRAAQEGSTYDDQGGLAELGFEVQLREFESGIGAGRHLAEAAFRSARSCGFPDVGGVAQDPIGAESRTRDFEVAVAKCAAQFSGTALGAPAVEAFYRSAFYSGLYGEAQFVLRQLSSKPAALRLASAIVEPAEGAASELQRWLTVSGAVVGGEREVRPLAELIESSHSLGSSVLLDLSKAIAEHSVSTDPFRRRPIPALFVQLDTRPSHRVVAARVAHRNLTSPWLFETFSHSAAEVAPHRSEELPALVAEMREETGRLREMVDDLAMPTYTQTVALDALSKLGKVDDAFVRSRYEVIARDPDGGVSPLVDFLEKRGDFAGAYTAVAAAIARNPDPGSIRWAYLRSEAARLKLRMGDPKAAWKLVEPAIATFKEDALLEGAEIELARGRFKSALELAQACLERYPESFEAAALVARARWSLDDFTVAAKELASSPTGIVGAWSRILPEAFVATFGGRPLEQTKRAFGELVAAGIPSYVLADAAIALGKKDGLEAALPLLESLPAPAPEWAVKIRLDTYDLIVEKSGEAAATAWYRAKHLPTVQDALILYQFRKYELLFALFPSHDKPTGPGVVRVLKIAALLHLKEVGGTRWQALAAEVALDQGSSDFFVRAALYLVGQGDADSVWDPEPHLDNLASVGWVMGVKAASERRFVDADGWFQVALESGQEQQPPHAWSWKIESDWMASKRALELLEKKGEF